MRKRDQFKSWATNFGQLSGRSHNSAWGNAQNLKDQAKDLISSVFAEVPNVRDNLLNRISGLFGSSPCCVTPDGVFISSSSDMLAQRDFENDIVEAQAIMEDCCRELERLAEMYR